MKIKLLLTCAVLLWSMTTTAQIYENKDEEGTVTFSDVPTPGAEEVDLQDTNTANSVDVPPPAPRQQETQRQEARRAPTELAPTVEEPTGIGVYDDDLLEIERAERRREELGERAVDAHPGERPVATPHRAPAHAGPGGGRP